jgi:hypothetical protein
MNSVVLATSESDRRQTALPASRAAPGRQLRVAASRKLDD